MIRLICSTAAAALFVACSVVTGPRPSTLLAQPETSPPALAHMPPATTVRTGTPGQPTAGAFGDLAGLVAIGDTVCVVDASGRETRERIVSISDVHLTVTAAGPDRVFHADTIRRVDRWRRDSIWNGVLMGAGAGALVGLGVGRSADSRSCPRSAVECGQGVLIGTAGGAIWGALGGWVVDALIRKRETVYAAAPTTGR